jgi:hypothetical protein
MLLLMFNALVYGRKAVEGTPPLPYSSFVFHALSAFLSAAKLALGLT